MYFMNVITGLLQGPFYYIIASRNYKKLQKNNTTAKMVFANFKSLIACMCADLLDKLYKIVNKHSVDYKFEVMY